MRPQAGDVVVHVGPVGVHVVQQRLPVLGLQDLGYVVVDSCVVAVGVAGFVAGVGPAVSIVSKLSITLQSKDILK